ncbi:MAG: tRNA 5-methoxyuridine(34)/uridine 5-oxyacetic acid(34) synthase CmoB [Planctomycetales bacterium]|nr:tRNA 5-methoxyuridine(34)/uridine 5-oxyacetic acid(34) synthase CmoB [Planctomycetales bacterium]
MTLFDREEVFHFFQRQGKGDWAQKLRGICADRLAPHAHGTLPTWIDAWHRLPERCQVHFDASGAAVAVDGSITSDGLATADSSLVETLQEFHPWRKGPFRILGVAIDTEWRSDWKWNRIAQTVDWRGKSVLDVGCGNGYYGWRMCEAGAGIVVGCDPLVLYIMQYEVLARYAPPPRRNFVLPIFDAELPEDLAVFDLVVSMGVLYHRSNPIDHLQRLKSALKLGGELLLETLVVDGGEDTVLVPHDRYAKMRNVWFLPSPAMLVRWLSRVGFTDVAVRDVSVTTADEQRRTEWMRFESLGDFLDPGDSSKTIEGYPAPQRACVTARRIR